ncbi:hypothetical protein HYW74_03060 [Candidatus Pacearchaeota archaeon]|nr:hypothetical protein [Candidatus Pacearchaeota archaeon]
MDTEHLSEELSEEEKMRQGNISLILDSYNDIFSDFDPRGYSERALSDDFLLECKRAARDKDLETGFELRLLVPKNRRNLNDEGKIKQRLKIHFHKHFRQKHDEIRSIKREGIAWVAMGLIFIFLATIIYAYKGFLFNLLFVILEPAGWFTLWSGLDKIFIISREKKPELDFYVKMANAKIVFISY